MKLTLKHLRYFRALVETGHFGRAAQVVGVTQPALSARIAELEAITGLRLAQRHARGATITDAGHALAARAADMLAAASEIETMASAFEGEITGTLRLGIIPSVAPYIASRLLTHAQADDLQLTVRETITQRLLDELEAGRLDAIIASAPLERAGVMAAQVLLDRFVLAVPPAQTPRDATDLDGQPPLSLLEEGHCLRDQVLQHCGLDAPPAERGVASIETLVELVAAGRCITFLPSLFLQAKPQHAERMTIVQFPDPQPTRPIVLAWRRSDPREQQFQRLAGRMAQWLTVQGA